MAAGLGLDYPVLAWTMVDEAARLLLKAPLSALENQEIVPVQWLTAANLHGSTSAGGAGIPAFYTKSGIGTTVADGKHTADFDGQAHVLERAIVADLALVHAREADGEGNLRYRYTAQNFNPLVAAAGRTTIAEAETLLTDTFLDPETARTPGIFVDRIVRADQRAKPIEKRTVRQIADDQNAVA
jgi:3-oxoacid CoA-transferase subunit A